MIDRLLAGAPLSLAPDWTDANTHDPGVTLLELHAFLAESALYRLSARGLVDGLAVSARDGDAPAVHVAPGMALDRQGQSVPFALPGVVSRYIGETEKHLGVVFSDAPRADATLICDDTAALFRRPD
jgi:hypothetical protein